MAITRRQFLRRTGLATAGAVLAPSLFDNPLLRHALAATDRYLVVFFLDGGNDGLNTIVPADNGFVGSGGLRDSYEVARLPGATGLRLGSDQVLVPDGSAPPMIDANTGSQIGFHPGLAGLMGMYDEGKVAVIQGCGYPRPNLSHDQSGRKWETGDPFGVLGENGWLGRYLGVSYLGNEIPGVNIRDNVAGEFRQGTTGVLALRRVTDFSFPYGGQTNQAERDRLDAAFAAVHDEAAAASLESVRYLGATGAVAQKATLAYPFLNTEYVAARPEFDAAYTGLNTQTARNLREIAKVIYGVATDAHPGVVTARYFQTRRGGFDTHSNQGGAAANGQQFGLFQEISQAVELFFQDLDGMQAGLGDRVTVLVWSEFSRRVRQNDSGTDHGSQGPMLLIGGGVNGGFYGNHPNIDPLALNNDGNTVYSQNPGDGFRSTDMRDVYGAVLKQWLGVADPSAFLPLDGGDPNAEWTSPDFDLPLFHP
jgi:uncharacterized protein (DUF1501 family)